ncbi:MAG: hypothetical protein KDB00_27345 [Planctomycetales bacterium]|nr:hypothetical protein [Planctomycetales bacterium]
MIHRRLQGIPRWRITLYMAVGQIAESVTDPLGDAQGCGCGRPLADIATCFRTHKAMPHAKSLLQKLASSRDEDDRLEARSSEHYR